MKRTILIAFLILLLPVWVWGAGETVWIDPTAGNDGGAGTEGSP